MLPLQQYLFAVMSSASTMPSVASPWMSRLMITSRSTDHGKPLSYSGGSSWNLSKSMLNRPLCLFHYHPPLLSSPNFSRDCVCRCSHPSLLNLIELGRSAVFNLHPLPPYFRIRCSDEFLPACPRRLSINNLALTPPHLPDQLPNHRLIRPDYRATRDLGANVASR